MPIKPPNLDDRRYDDIVREARALIPQYCPDWTNLSDADPGMTLVQLFAWMTEMTVFRLNQVPDKTYVHFLNFIGEERRTAQPAEVPVTFSLFTEEAGAAEVPPFSRVSTVAERGGEALHFLTTDRLTVHGATIDRVVAVVGGGTPTVREIRPEVRESDPPSVIRLGGEGGVQVFEADPAVHGRHAYTSEHHLYLGHDDFGGLDFRVGGGQEAGRLRLRTTGERAAPIADLFRWEGHTAEGWVPMPVVHEEALVRGLPDVSIVAQVPDQAPLEHFGPDSDPLPLPEAFRGTTRWIRGVVDYERWLAERMDEDLEITWQDDRGGDRRTLTSWSVRSTGRALELSIQDLPPIRAGWSLALTMVDRGMPAGRDGYFPRYRFSMRQGERWVRIPEGRVRQQGSSFVITGPLLDLATDGVNLRAERTETVFLRAMVPDLGIEATWLRPVEVHLAAGSGVANAERLERASLPVHPFEPALGLPAAMGMKLYVGSELFTSDTRRPVAVELDVSFEVDGELIPEPLEQYHLQLTYRTRDAWRVVPTGDDQFSRFTFADLEPSGAGAPGRRRVRFVLDPSAHLQGAVRATVAGIEASWLRLELTKAQLLHQPDPTRPPVAIATVVHAVRVVLDEAPDQTTFEQALPGLKIATVEHRPENRRMSRAIVRERGRLTEHTPFDTFIDLTDDGPPHWGLYLRLTRPLPAGSRHAVTFRCLGQAFLPEGVRVSWELLEGAGNALRWRRLASDDGAYRFGGTGTLSFPMPERSAQAAPGTWLRAILRAPDGEALPPLPPLSHILLNTVGAVNLHRFTTERFSGLGVPNQSLTLRRSPLFVRGARPEHDPLRGAPDFTELEVLVTDEAGETHTWRLAPGNSMLSVGHDDRVFTVDPVEGVLTFGNGLRGRMLPVGQNNVSVEVYHVVPGAAGNVAPGQIRSAEELADRVTVTNALPGRGGRDAESIDEIIRRAPAVLTSRDRAVTRADFEIVAAEASGQVARAACAGPMGDDGEIGVVVLPRRRAGELLPDVFLAGGLEQHVQEYLARRCLVNVQPRVRLATFQHVDVSVTLRLRPHVNVVRAREDAEAWVRCFLDPYEGGIDGEGWPFGGALYAQDVGRMVSELGDVRHVVAVGAYAVDAGDATPGWEQTVGVSELELEDRDLFALRHVRVVLEGPA